jgi:hypothetical protein
VAVYVDDAMIAADVPNGPVVHHSRWSHLWADTEEELHGFAVNKLGLRRSYFQPAEDHHGFAHYDLTEGKRWQALRYGAVAVDWRQTAEVSRERRQQAQSGGADRGQQFAERANQDAAAAFFAGDLARAAHYLNAAAAAYPARAREFAGHMDRVHAALREKGAQATGPDDPRPLAEVTAARLQAAGIGADDPGVLFAHAWNTEVYLHRAEREQDDREALGQDGSQATLDDPGPGRPQADPAQAVPTQAEPAGPEAER